MKQSFGIFLLVVCYYTTSAMALTINKDSLIRIAKATTDQSQKAHIYRDLADFYAKSLKRHTISNYCTSWVRKRKTKNWYWMP